MTKRLFEMLDNWLTMKDPRKNDLHYPDYSCCRPILEINNDMKRLMIAAVKECNAEMVNIIQETLDARYVKLERELSDEFFASTSKDGEKTNVH